MGQVSKKYDWGNNQKENEYIYMPFYHNPINFISEMVSIRRSRITRNEKTCKITSRGQKKKIDAFPSSSIDSNESLK